MGFLLEAFEPVGSLAKFVLNCTLAAKPDAIGVIALGSIGGEKARDALIGLVKSKI